MKELPKKMKLHSQEGMNEMVLQSWYKINEILDYLESQKEELKKRIEGKRIVVEEKEKGTYYAQHCNGYNQALDDIITELNHQ